MSSKIESAILAATKSSRIKEGEAFQVYLNRLVKAIDALSETAWADLDKGAAVWFNDACAAIGSNKPIQNFPDETGDKEEAPATPQATRIRATPVAAASPKKEAATPEASAAAPGAAKTARPKGRGGVKLLKTMIFSNPNFSKEKIKEMFSAAAEKEGCMVGDATFESVVYDTMQSISILRELKLWGGAAA